MSFPTIELRRKQFLEKDRAESFLRRLKKLNPNAELSLSEESYSDISSDLTITDLYKIVIPVNSRFIGNPYESSFYGFVCILYDRIQYTIYVKDYKKFF